MHMHATTLDITALTKACTSHYQVTQTLLYYYCPQLSSTRLVINWWLLLYMSQEMTSDQLHEERSTSFYYYSNCLCIHLQPERPDTAETPPDMGLTLVVTVEGYDMANESNPSFCISASML